MKGAPLLNTASARFAAGRVFPDPLPEAQHVDDLAVGVRPEHVGFATPQRRRRDLPERFPGNTPGNVRGSMGELRAERRRDHLAVAADEDRAAVLHHHVEGAVVQQPVVRAAQQHQVVEARLAAVDPVPDVVRLQVPLVGAAREAAAVVVAQPERPREPRRHDAPPALVVEEVAPASWINSVTSASQATWRASSPSTPQSGATW